MDASEELYYTENPEIIDGEAWGMQQTVIVNNENLNWQDEPGEITVSYADAESQDDDTLTENEVYLSTNAEDSVDADKSQYYSILESTYQSEEDEYVSNVNTNIIVKVDNGHESILPDLPNNDYIVQRGLEKEQEVDDSLNNQVVLYHSDNPNEMYAVQIADDGNGNLQRYKYKVRQTPEGELEAIPGTIEVQDASIEDEILQQTAISHEMLNPKIEVTELPEIEQENHETEYTEHNMQSAGNFEEVSVMNQEENMMTEEQHVLNEEHIMSEEHINQEHMVEEHIMNEEHMTDEHIMTDEHVMNEEHEEHVMNDEEHVMNDELSNMPDDNFEAEYLEEEYDNPEYLLENPEDNYNEDGNEYMLSPNEDDLALKMSKSYHLNELDYMDTKIKNNNIKMEVIDKKIITQPNVIKRKFFKTRNLEQLTIVRDKKNVSYLVSYSKEKENLAMKKNTPTFGLKNARSILKSNYIVSTEEQNKNNVKKTHVIRMLNKNDIKDENKSPIENKIKPKAARTPRKQEIKPVDRVGSEIIVQPMYYTFNNDFVPEPEVRKKRKYNSRHSNEIVRVSDDSDPDYTEKPKPKKKKKTRGSLGKSKKIPEIMILDSDIESSDEDSVIEVFSDDDEENKKDDDEKENDDATKKNDKEIENNDEDKENDDKEEETEDKEKKSDEEGKKNDDMKKNNEGKKKIEGGRRNSERAKKNEEESTKNEVKINKDKKDEVKKNEVKKNKDEVKKNDGNEIKNKKDISKTNKIEVKKNKDDNKINKVDIKKSKDEVKKSNDVNKKNKEDTNHKAETKKTKESDEESESVSEEKVEENSLDTFDDIQKIQEAVDDIVQERKKAEELKSKDEEKSTGDKKTQNPIKSNEKFKGKNIKCPMCPKTFPRQINLKTHMNIHNTRRILRSKANTLEEKKEVKPVKDIKNDVNKKVVSEPKKSENFNCLKCKQKFFSKLQLARHQTIHEKKKTEVLLPKKLTTTKNISPKKLRTPTRSTQLTTRLLPLKPKTKTDDLRKNSVKTPVIKKTSLRSTSIKKSVKTLLCCEVCKKFFTTLTKLHEHEILVHKKQNTNTIVKRIITRPKKAHGGVPASAKMQKAFVMKMKS